MQIVDDILEHSIDLEIAGFHFEIIQDDHMGVIVGFRSCYTNIDTPLFYRALSQAYEVAQLLDISIELEIQYRVWADFYDLDRFEERLQEDDDLFQLAERKIGKLLYQDIVPVGQMTADFIEMMKRVQSRKPRPIAELNERSKRAGFVYLVRADTGHYKIGKTVNPKDRMKTFGVKLPFRVQYELVIQTNDYTALEMELHQRFAYCRLDGEWFSLNDGDVADLAREFADNLVEVD